MITDGREKVTAAISGESPIAMSRKSFENGCLRRSVLSFTFRPFEVTIARPASVARSSITAASSSVAAASVRSDQPVSFCQSASVASSRHLNRALSAVTPPPPPSAAPPSPSLGRNIGAKQRRRRASVTSPIVS